MSGAKGAATRTIALIAAALVAACGSAPLRDPGGRLAPCPAAPNCVSSVDRDPDRRVEPLYYRGSRETARERLLRALATLPRTRIVQAQADYIRAECRTAVMRFVDDLELLLPADQNRIEVRSASRVGYYDYGVNRGRVDELRAAWNATE